MVITWHGFSCLKLQTKETTFLINPFVTSDGLTGPRLTSDCILLPSVGHPLAERAGEAKGFVVAEPGEYEFRGVFLHGIGVTDGEGAKAVTRIVYAIEAEGVTVGVLSELGRALAPDEEEQLPDIDVLFVPVGGKPVLNAEQAVKIVNSIEPRVVIPFHYKVGGMKGGLETADAFRKEMGAKSGDAITRYRVTKKDLPQEDTQLVFLTPEA